VPWCLFWVAAIVIQEEGKKKKKKGCENLLMVGGA
jgi:hypothetical protein